MSIAEQITKSAQNLSNARKAILLKGGNVGDNPAFNNLASEIESIPSGDANYVLVDDTDTAYRKSILAGASPLAKLKSLGGMTYKRLREDGNLLPYPYITTGDNAGTFTVSQDSFVDDWNLEARATLIDSSNAITLPAGTYSLAFNASVDTEIDDMSPAGMVELNGEQVGYETGADIVVTFTLDADTVVTSLTVSYEWQMNLFPDLPATGSISPVLYEEGNEVDFAPRGYELVDTVVEKVVSCGANLIPFPYVDKSTVTRNGITYTVNDDGSITANGTSTAQAYFILFRGVLPIGEYFLSGAPKDGNKDTMIYAANTNYSLYKPDTGSGVVFNITTEEEITIAISIQKEVIASNLVFKPMVNFGRVAIPYKPYREPITYTIPEALQGSGKGVKGYSTTYADTVDLERGKFVEKCETITLNGSESWLAYTVSVLPSGIYCYYNSTIKANGKVGIFTSICSHFDNIESAWDVARRTGVYSDHPTLPNLYFVTDRATVDEWKAYLSEQYANGNPVTLTYALAEPIETDLPETFSNLIEVEGGGSLEFVNEYSNAVPSHISYLRRIV